MKITMKEKNTLKDLFWFFIKALVLVVILINFVFIPCVVNGSSMNPTYNEGEYGYSFIITKKLGINRFDTAVIRASASNEKLLVKRVIGMPNDTLEYKDNKLYINGVYYEEGEDEYYDESGLIPEDAVPDESGVQEETE